MSGSDSDESVDQLEQFRNANVKPGMFVSGWEDPNDEVYPEENPEGMWIYAESHCSISQFHIIFLLFSIHTIETLEKKILWATGEGKAELVEEILQSNPNVHSAVDSDGYTPLHRACYNNHVDIARLLIKHGADVNARTQYGWTPLHSAVKWSNADAAALLLQHGSDVNALSDGQQTPLHVAATVSNCRETAMTLMLDPNCDASLLNNSNETAAEIARRTGLSYPLFDMGHSAYSVETGLID